ncbi:hypothetical protein ACJJTC_005699 [Scirpophaga incertulas]
MEANERLRATATHASVLRTRRQPSVRQIHVYLSHMTIYKGAFKYYGYIPDNARVSRSLRRDRRTAIRRHYEARAVATSPIYTLVYAGLILYILRYALRFTIQLYIDSARVALQRATTDSCEDAKNIQMCIRTSENLEQYTPQECYI